MQGSEGKIDLYKRMRGRREEGGRGAKWGKEEGQYRSYVRGDRKEENKRREGKREGRRVLKIEGTESGDKRITGKWRDK